MIRQRNKTKATVAARRGRKSSRASFEIVMRELSSATAPGETVDPLMERLRQCPEAFKAGELLAKAFDTLKYAADECDSRYLPPAGTVMPLF